MDNLCVLAFDFGRLSIGVAVGQTITATAVPLPPLRADQGHPDWQAVDEIIQAWAPHQLVVGWPESLDGKPQRIQKSTRGFIKALKRRYPQYPVYTVDERYTTCEARAQLFEAGGKASLKKGLVDSYSAKLIGESYLRALTTRDDQEDGTPHSPHHTPDDTIDQQPNNESK